MQESRSPGRHWLDFLAPFALLSLVATSSLRQEDIRFWDESMYLERGLSLGFGSQPGWEWNPLYTDMYWLLGRVFDDPIDLYFAGRVTSAAFVVLAVWLSLRFFTRSWVALAGGLVAAALPITYVWPGVSSPSAGFIIVALAIVWRWRTPASQVAGSVLTWLAAATRPEFVWVALLVTVIVGTYVVIRAVRRVSRPGRSVGLLIGLVVAPTILTIGYGSPTDLGTRSWEAFEQHYELRFATEDDDPWQVDADIVGRDFPGARSVPAAIAVNPSAVAVHAARNVTRLPVSAGGHLMGLGGDSTEQNIIGITAALAWLVGLAIALLRPRSLIRDFLRRTGRHLREPSSRVPVVVTITLVGASLISTVVIYPRPHYLVVLIAGAVLISGLLIDRLGRTEVMRWIPLAAVSALSAASLVFNVASLGAEGDTDKPYAASLRAMNASDTSWRLLTPERPISIYLTRGTQVLNVDDEYSSFSDLLDGERINAVFDGILLRQADYSNLPDFQEFLDRPGDFGFQPITQTSPFLVRVNHSP